MGTLDTRSPSTGPTPSAAFQTVPTSSIPHKTFKPRVTEPGSNINLDTIPDTQVLFCPPHGYLATPSAAKTIPNKKGIFSHDPILDQDADELWRYLLSNLTTAPSMSVRVHGTHTETSTSTDSKGRSSTTSHTVTDFSITIDVSKYVIPQWTRIVAQPKSRKPDRAKSAMPTIREAIEEYTNSRNQFKEFRLAKCVVWSYDRLTQLLTDLVRSTGYRHSVHVSFPMRNYKVVALASSEWSRAAHSKVVRVLCVVSCLWILFWPAWALARKPMKNRLSCEWGMGIGVEEFYGREWGRVREAVVQRRKQEQMDAL